MMPANVKLSKNELSLVCDEQFILTKNNIIEKVSQLYGLLSNSFTNTLSESTNLPAEILSASPKIYKGEQYEGLPYVMLDNPRCFNKQDAFAIRCFFGGAIFSASRCILVGGICNYTCLPYSNR